MTKKNRDALISVMDDYGINIKTVAALISRSNASVRQFRSVSGNDITDNDLELLELKLSAKYDIKN